MISIGILVFDDVDSVDVAAQYEVFSTAARIHALQCPRQTLFRCYLIGAEMRTIRARGGMKLLPDCVLLPASDIDVLIIPGGNVSNVLEHNATIEWIKTRAKDSRVTAAVRSGGLVLAKAGLAAWCDYGKVLTCNGPTAGIELSLHLVQQFAGPALACATAREIDYCRNNHANTPKATATTVTIFTTAAADTSLFLAA